MPASSRSVHTEQWKIEAFLRRPDVWFWTFTFAENQQDKAYAERCLGRLEDKLRRMGAEWYHVWELQKRGAWHVHMLVNRYLDVGWLRPWMQARGWGPIMKGVKVHDDGSRRRVASYLVKYLRKGVGFQRRMVEGRMSLQDAELMPQEAPPAPACMAVAVVPLAHKKLAGCSLGARVANTLWRWNPWISGRPAAYLWWVGRSMFVELFGEQPRWKDISTCIRLGYEDSNYGDLDPFYIPP